MRNTLSRVVPFVRRLWLLLWRQAPHEPIPDLLCDAACQVPDVPSAIEPRAEAPVMVRRRAPRAPRQMDAVWQFRSSILERLDEYFVCIRRLRRHDPKSYELFSRIGFAVPADAFASPECPMQRAAIVESLVSFGGVLMPADETFSKDEIRPSFLYFKKMEHPSRVQAFSGAAIYELTLLYDHRDASQRWRSRLTVPMRCYVGVSADGTMVALKEAVSTCSTIQPRAAKGKPKPHPVTLRGQRWQLPEWVLAVAPEHGDDLHQWVGGLLVLALRTYVEAVSRIVIRVKHHDGCVAAFGIDLPRAKTFFADRDVTALARDGRRKRIFHSVVEHTRVTSTVTTQVKHHYRGIRAFDWNGYAIRIVLPEHGRILGFDKASHYSEDVPRRQRSRWIGEPEVGEKLAAVLDE